VSRHVRRGCPFRTAPDGFDMLKVSDPKQILILLAMNK